VGFDLLRQRKALQRFAMRPGYAPGMKYCQAIAKELVEHLKRAEEEKIMRRQNTRRTGFRDSRAFTARKTTRLRRSQEA